MKKFREIRASELNAEAMKSEMDAQGYLFIRGLLPKEDVRDLLAQITAKMSAAGWLLPQYDPLQRMVNNSVTITNSSYGQLQDEVCDMQALHSFMHHLRLQHVMKMLVGPRLLVHPKAAARIILPKVERMTIHAHQDHQDPHVLGGDHECFTVWMPLHDCPVKIGPLRILEASHRYGLQDADPVSSYVLKYSMRGGDWVADQIDAGDVLIFHSLTVHEALPNVSDQIRVSAQFRFQDYARTINPGSLVFTGNGNKSWESLYSGWSEKDLQYYWQRLPLRLKPSKDDLEQLARTADSAERRALYARILEKIQGQ